MRRKTKRIKIDNYWCSIYANLFAKNIWNLGLIINQSKRASNDWFERRKNHRVRRVKNEKRVKTLRQLRGCLQVVEFMLADLPEEDHVFIINDYAKAQTLSKYVERLGFIPIPDEDRLIWVLTAQKRREVLHRFVRTTKLNEKTNDLLIDTVCEKHQRSLKDPPYPIS